MSERLEVHLNNTYLDMKLISTAQIWDDSRLVSEWTTSDNEKLIFDAIDSTEDSMFDKVRIKKKVLQAMKLFEPKIVTIESKEK